MTDNSYFDYDLDNMVYVLDENSELKQSIEEQIGKTIFLTGSRKFGVEKTSSDYDYFCTNEVALNVGFYDYCKNNLVYMRYFEQRNVYFSFSNKIIDIMVLNEETFEWVRKATNLLYTLALSNKLFKEVIKNRELRILFWAAFVGFYKGEKFKIEGF
jgi:hypothetical protein